MRRGLAYARVAPQRRGAVRPVIRDAICLNFCWVLGFAAALRPRCIIARPRALLRNPLIRSVIVAIVRTPS